MKLTLEDKLWRSSNAIRKLYFEKDDLGLMQLNKRGATVSFIVVTILFLFISWWA